MPLLPGFRSMFTRRRSIVEIDLADDRPGPVRPAPVASRTGDAAPSDPANGPLMRPEPAPARGSEEVLGLVRKIGDHLDKQSEHTSRLDTLIERLPPAIDALPEINRQNARLLDVLGAHLDRSRAREDAVQSMLGRMGEVSGHQTEVLGLVRDQLDSSSRAVGQMIETLGSVRQTLTDLSDTTQRSVLMLSEMVQVSERRSSELVDLFGRTQRWMVAAVVCCGLVSVAAVTLAMAVFLG